jgi:hypothetical protein
MDIYECSCCKFLTNSQFNFKRHLTTKKHINKSKVTKPKDDMKEITSLLKLQIELQQKQIENQTKQLELQKKSGNVQIQINNIHYNLLPYQNTDISHLTDEDFIQCVNENNCVIHLIEKIHFNPRKPENRNIIISNLKDKYMKIYDGEWRTVHKKQLNKIYGDKETIINDWILEEKYPKLTQRFMSYLQQKEYHKIKEEIKLMMYDKQTPLKNINAIME